MQIDLNCDLGEGYGPWTMGRDADLLAIVSSANIACGGHAGDSNTMVETLQRAKDRAVSVGAHPGYADPLGFGRRVIPMAAAEIERMVAVQIGALMGAAALVGVAVGYVKAHGALANLAADEPAVAQAIARATRAISPDLALLAIAGTELVAAGHAAGLPVFSEVFADRGYLANGRLVPRAHPQALLHDPRQAAARMVAFLNSGSMPTIDGPAVALQAQSICVHGDGPEAVEMARLLRSELAVAGVHVRAFLPATSGLA